MEFNDNAKVDDMNNDHGQNHVDNGLVKADDQVSNPII